MESLKTILFEIGEKSIKEYTKDEIFGLFYLCIKSNEIFKIADYCSSVPDIDSVYKFRESTYKIFNTATGYASNLKSELKFACRQLKNVIGKYNNPVMISLHDLRDAEEKWDIACNLIKEYSKDMNLVFLWMQSYIRVFENQISKTIIFSWLIRLKTIVEEMEV